jgi:hypothetical protein
MYPLPPDIPDRMRPVDGKIPPEMRGSLVFSSFFSWFGRLDGVCELKPPESTNPVPMSEHKEEFMQSGIQHIERVLGIINQVTGHSTERLVDLLHQLARPYQTGEEDLFRSLLMDTSGNVFCPPGRVV